MTISGTTVTYNQANIEAEKVCFLNGFETTDSGTAPMTASMPPHRTAPHRTAPHRTAPHRTAPRRTAPHRTAPHQHMSEGLWAGGRAAMR